MNNDDEKAIRKSLADAAWQAIRAEARSEGNMIEDIFVLREQFVKWAGEEYDYMIHHS